MQSQDYAGAKWAIAQRLVNVFDSDLDELFNSGKILRTHVMRPTWHFVAPEDIRWLLQITAHRVNAASAYYFRSVELDARVFRRTNATISKALRGGVHLTRGELAARLLRAGIAVTGLRLVYIIMRAELDGVICSGPLRGRQFTYALLEERVPPAKTRTREEALCELTTRYFAGHGPALIEDFAWWSGLTLTEAREGVQLARTRITQHTFDGRAYWMDTQSASDLRPEHKRNPGALVRLLPNYDEYLIAYKERSTSSHPLLKGRLKAGDSPVTAHLVVRDGYVIGGWRRALKKNEVTISVNLLLPISAAERKALLVECNRYAAFLGKEHMELELKIR
jgi:hypothetical protein